MDRQILKILIFTMLALIFFNGIVIVSNVTVAKAVAIIIIPIYIIFRLGELAIKKNLDIAPFLFKYIFIFLLFMLMGNISLLLSSSPALFNEKYLSMWSLFLFSIIIADGIRNSRDLWFAFKLLAVSGLIAGFTVLIQYFTGYTFSNIGTYHDYMSFNVIRPTGVFGDPNFAALNLNIVLLLFYALIKKEDNKYSLWLCTAGFMVCSFAIILTQSRGGLISLLLIFLYIFHVEKMRIKYLIFFALIGIGIIYFIIQSPEFLNAMNYRYMVTKNLISDIQNDDFGRIYYAKQALVMIADAPFWGLGIGQYSEGLFKVSFESNITHNIYLEIGAEQGLIGLSIFAYLIFSFFSVLKHINKRTQTKISLQLFSVCIGGGLFIFFINGLLLSALHEKIFWVLLSFILVLDRLKYSSEMQPINKENSQPLCCKESL
jgi:O-antigen ligase